MLAAQEAGRDAARPGALAREVNAACRAPIEDAGLGAGFRHRMGHGIGLDVHERPFLSVEDDTPLEAGMTFTDEPSILVDGSFGVRVEDVIVVSRDGREDALRAHSAHERARVFRWPSSTRSRRRASSASPGSSCSAIFSSSASMCARARPHRAGRPRRRRSPAARGRRAAASPRSAPSGTAPCRAARCAPPPVPVAQLVGRPPRGASRPRGSTPRRAASRALGRSGCGSPARRRRATARSASAGRSRFAGGPRAAPARHGQCSYRSVPVILDMSL